MNLDEFSTPIFQSGQPASSGLDKFSTKISSGGINQNPQQFPFSRELNEEEKAKLAQERYRTYLRNLAEQNARRIGIPEARIPEVTEQWVQANLALQADSPSPTEAELAANEARKTQPPLERGYATEIGAALGTGLLDLQDSALGVSQGVIDNLPLSDDARIRANLNILRYSQGVSDLRPMFRPSDSLDGKEFDPTNPKWWVSGGARMVPQLGMQAAIAGATGGTSLPKQLLGFAATGGAMEAGSAYNEARERMLQRGATLKEATRAATTEAGLVGAVNSAIEILPGYAILKKNPAARQVFNQTLRSRLAGVAGKTAGGFVSEGAEEATQDAWTDTVRWMVENDPESFGEWQKYAGSFALGGLAGAGFGGGAAIAEDAQNQQISKQIARANKEAVERERSWRAFNDFRNAYDGTSQKIEVAKQQRAQVEQATSIPEVQQPNQPAGPKADYDAMATELGKQERQLYREFYSNPASAVIWATENPEKAAQLANGGRYTAAAFSKADPELPVLQGQEGDTDTRRKWFRAVQDVVNAPEDIRAVYSQAAQAGLDASSNQIPISRDWQYVGASGMKIPDNPNLEVHRGPIGAFVRLKNRPQIQAEESQVVEPVQVPLAAQVATPEATTIQPVVESVQPHPLSGRKVVVSAPHLRRRLVGTVEGLVESPSGLPSIQIRHPDGKTSVQLEDSIQPVEEYISSRESKNKQVDPGIRDFASDRPTESMPVQLSVELQSQPQIQPLVPPQSETPLTGGVSDAATAGPISPEMAGSTPAVPPSVQLVNQTPEQVEQVWRQYFPDRRIAPGKTQMIRMIEEVQPASTSSTGQAAIQQQEPIQPAQSALPKSTKFGNFIGKNQNGATVYEDERGVRSIALDNGIVLNEKVQLIPTRSGYQYGIDIENRDSDFKTQEELSKEQPNAGNPRVQPAGNESVTGTPAADIAVGGNQASPRVEPVAAQPAATPVNQPAAETRPDAGRTEAATPRPQATTEQTPVSEPAAQSQPKSQAKAVPELTDEAAIERWLMGDDDPGSPPPSPQIATQQQSPAEPKKPGFKKKSTPTLADLQNVAFDELPKDSETIGVARNRGKRYRNQKFVATDESGKEKEYKVTVDSSGNRKVEDLGYTKKQREANKKAEQEAWAERNAFEPGIAPVKDSTPKKLAKALDEIEKRQSANYSVIETAKQTGWATNGNYMVKATPSDLKEIQAKASSSKRLVPFSKVIEQVETANVPAEIAGSSKDDFGTTYLIEAQRPEGTIQKQVDAEFHQLIAGRYPNAKMFVASDVDPVAYRDGDNLVGVLMPLRTPKGVTLQVKKPAESPATLETSSKKPGFRKKGQPSERTQKSKQELDAAQQELRDALRDAGVELTSGVNPKLLRPAAKFVAKYVAYRTNQLIDAGQDVYHDFADMVRYLRDTFGDAATRQLGPALEEHWAKFNSARPEQFTAPRATNEVLDEQTQGNAERPGTAGNRDRTAVEENSPASGQGDGGKRDTVRDGQGSGNASSADARRPVEAGNERGRGSQDGTRRVRKPAGPEQRTATSGVRKPSGNAVGQNFVLTSNEVEQGGTITHYKRNVDAIRLLKQIESENRLATPEEQQVLSLYTGWGQVPQVFIPETELEKLGIVKDGQWNLKNLDKLPDGKWKARQKEMIEALTPDEYAAARGSTKNAHYTSPEVVRAIWDSLAKQGFTGGRINEPGIGSGLFFGTMPSDIAAKSQLHAVELDSISARLSGQLYQTADVKNEEFQKVSYPDDSFDLFISNVPFANVNIKSGPDGDLAKLNAPLHDFYFAKAIKKTRPGGLVVFITSRFSMDKVDSGFRKAWEKLGGDFIGAIRLPNDAFGKIANTDVVTDIVVFQKRDPDASPNSVPFKNLSSVDALNSSGEKVSLSVNEYFADNPKMVLGTLAATGTMRGKDELTVESNGKPLGDQIRKAFEKIAIDRDALRNAKKPANIEESKKPTPSRTEAEPGTLFLDGNTLRKQFDGFSEVVKEELTGTSLERMKELIGLRDTVRDLLRLQIDPTAKESAVEAARKRLNKEYDAFIAKGRNWLNSTYNVSQFREDDFAPLLWSIENYDADAKAATKADIFSKRTQFPTREITSAESPEQALSFSLSERGSVDLDYMAELLGKTPDEVRSGLGTLVYENPEGGLETAAEYLSGNVRRKLRVATEAAAKDAKYKPNVDALEKLQPEDLPPGQITPRLGAAWIPTDVYKQFIEETLGISVEVKPVGGQEGGWVISDASDGFRRSLTEKETSDFGTKRMGAIDIMSRYMNHREIVVRDMVKGGGSVVNKDETAAARQKLEKIKETFASWLWDDFKRSERLVRLYNDLYNNKIEPEHDGSHLRLPGMSQTWLDRFGGPGREYQKNTVWRFLTNGNTLLAHVVGAGKTAQMAAMAMEARRLGLMKKPVFVVPNHLIEQWPKEFLEIYPGAKVLAAQTKDFQPKNRRTLMSRIATGDWDAVIVPMTSFEKIPMSPKVVQEFFRKQINELEEEIISARREKGDNKNLVKELEKARDRLKELLAKQQADHKKDIGPYFDELGIDGLFVDEAHEFKNLWFRTKMNRVPGVASQQTQKTFDMYQKTEYLNRVTNGRGIVFATGTPVANTLSEMFTMQRYLQPGVLKDAGIESFDFWANMFGESVTDAEISPDGSSLRVHTRFAKFVNVPELMGMFRQVADVRTADMLKLPRPSMNGGKAQSVEIFKTDDVSEYIESLIKRAESVRSGRVDPRADNMLKITSEGRKVAIDMRLIDPTAIEDPNGKINIAADRVHSIWEKTKSFKGAQIIWSDLGIPRKEKKWSPLQRKFAERIVDMTSNGELVDLISLRDEYKSQSSSKSPATEFRELLRSIEPEVQFNESDIGEGINLGDKAEPNWVSVIISADADLLNTTGGGFSVYGELKKKLIQRGIPASDIAFVQDADTKTKKQKLFSDLRSGKVRVVFASTAKMGTGANVQTRLVAAHHLDAPWRPADVEQRDGRIIRPGNRSLQLAEENGVDMKGVDVIRYVTKGSFDAYMWQGLERKAKFIEQVLTGNAGTREAEDIGGQSLSFAEMKAAASENPKLLEYTVKRSKLQELEGAKRAFDSESYSKRRLLNDLPSMITKEQDRLDALEFALEMYQNNTRNQDGLDGGNSPAMTIGGTKYTKRSEAGDALLEVLNSEPKTKSLIGEVSGFSIVYQGKGKQSWRDTDLSHEFFIEKGKYKWSLFASESGIGTITRIINAIENIPNNIDDAKSEIARLERQQAELQQRVGNKFEKQAELEKLRAEVTKLETELMNNNQGQQQPTQQQQPQDDSPQQADGTIDDILKQADDDAPRAEASGFFGGGRIRTQDYGPDDVPEVAKFSHPEVQRRVTQAYGIKAPTWSEWGKEFKDSVLRKFRSREFIDPEKFPVADDVLRRLQDVPSRALDNASRVVGAIVAPLAAKNQYALFNSNVIAENLVASFEVGQPLRMGYETVKGNPVELAKIDLYNFRRAADQTPNVKEALRRRKNAMRDLVGKMVKQKLIPKSVLDNVDTYYHQQVLMYAKSERFAQIQGIENRKFGLQKRRVKGPEGLGEKYDYNTNYVQAEIAWMADAFAALELKSLRSEMESEYDIRKQLERKAKKQNYLALVGGQENANRIEELKRLMQTEMPGDQKRMVADELTSLDPTYPYRIKLAIAFEQLAKAHPGIFSKKSIDSELDAELDEFMSGGSDNESSMWGEIRRISKDYSEPGQGAALGVLAAISKRNKMIQDRLGDNFATWQRLVGEDYEVWTPEPGTVFYPAYTIPEKVVEQFQQGVIDSFELTPDQVKMVFALGGIRGQMVLPKEIVQQLRVLKKGQSKQVQMMAGEISRLWKEWTLHAPHRIVGYSLRNVTGDLDAVVAGNPDALRYALPAWRELREFYNRHTLATSPELKRAVELSVVGSSFVHEEIDKFQEDKHFKRLFEAAEQKPGLPPSPQAIARLYRDWAMVKGNIREGVLRYAAYKSFKAQLDAGTLRNYAASNPAVIKQLQKSSGNDVAAARLARELLGDYGSISEYGQWIRSTLMPFWSFQEINLKRYPRLVINGLRAGNVGGVAGMLGVRSAIIASRVAWMYGLYWLANNLLHPEEEDQLQEYDRQNPHIILGRRADGSIRLIRNVGALGDFLEWFGINDISGDIPEYMDGRVSTGDLASKAARAPLNKLLGSLAPWIKALYEIPSGTTTFPDATRIRQKNRDELAAGIVGGEEEYKWARGKVLEDGSTIRPHYWERWIGLAVNRPKDSALSDIYAARDLFLKQEGVERPNVLSESKYKKIRDAVKNEDYEAFRDARQGLIEKNGGDYEKTLEGWNRYLSGLDPIANTLNAEREAKFIGEFLRPDEREKLDIARQYAAEVRDLSETWWETASREDDTPDQRKLLEAEYRRRRKLDLDLAQGKGRPQRQNGESLDDYKIRLGDWRSRQDAARKRLSLQREKAANQ